jgi:hypothetical protein
MTMPRAKGQGANAAILQICGRPWLIQRLRVCQDSYEKLCTNNLYIGHLRTPIEMEVDMYTLLAWASHHEPAASPFLHRTLLSHFFHRPPEAEVEPKTVSTSSRREHLGGSDLDPDVGYLGHYLITDLRWRFGFLLFVLDVYICILYFPTC